MKYLLTLFILICLGATAEAQWWFDAGVKGAYGLTGMSDQNVYDSGTYKHKLSSGTSVGGRLGFNYGYHVGLSLEYAGATGNQDFNYNGSVYNSYTWKHNDVSLLFRYSGNGAYVEIGAENSQIKEVELESKDLAAPTDVTDKFSDNYTSGVLGFGSYLMGGGLFTVNIGIRLHWAFDDMVNEEGKAENYPIVVEPLEDPSKKTLAAAAQLQLEANYAFGRFAKSACHDKWRLILFQ